ncbi:MAG TPA: CopD family protein [Acidimicrobiales bacterium]|nr:CopD family protein [Acidimicrobiales bacterium]
MAGGTIRHDTAAERTAGPRRNGGQPSGPAVGRPHVGRVSATAPFEPAPPQVLLVAALLAAASAVLLAIARSTAGDAVVTPVVTACVRAASYVGLVMAVGSTAFVTLVWPRGRGDRRLAMMVWFGWLTIGAATVLQLALHEGAGVLAPGGDRIAKALALRLGVLLAGVAWTSAAMRGRPTSRVAGLALLVALTSTWIYAGPVAPGVGTAMVTVVHIAAACLWAGGLAVLAVVLMPLGRTAALARVLARFSRLATVCVAVLAVSGTLHAVSRTGSAGNLFTTRYGYVFWLKVAAVGVMLLVANGNRHYVLRHIRKARPSPIRPAAVGANRHAANGGGTADAQRDGAPPLQMLGLFLGAEIAFGLLVMVLTAVLVGAPVSR